MNTIQAPDPSLTMREAADVLKINLRKVRRLIAARQLKAVRHSPNVKTIKLSAIAEYERRRTL